MLLSECRTSDPPTGTLVCGTDTATQSAEGDVPIEGPRGDVAWDLSVEVRPGRDLGVLPHETRTAPWPNLSALVCSVRISGMGPGM